MNIKRFIAGSSREALRMVKKEMGPDAVILRTRTLPAPEQGSEAGRDRVEVTAAVDYTAPEVPARAGGRGAPHPDTVSERWRVLERELKDIKAALLSAESSRGLSPELYYDRSIRSMHGHFMSFGLKPEIVDDIMTELYRGGRPGNGANEADLLRESLSRTLRRVAVAPPRRIPGTQEIYAFIGPTGVGKTTTLAKLAALRAVKQGVSTALITLDTFRIAAVSQLQTYGRIMGVPLYVASGRTELDDAIRRSRDADLILIDTAGRSPNQEEELQTLARLFGDREDVHHFLVLSATTDYGNLLRAREQFGRIPFKSYIFTKLDEVVDASAMLNFLAAGRKPVSYFTTGQQVPEDIEVATRKRLAKLMLGPAGIAAGSPSGDANEETEHGSSNRSQVPGRGSNGAA
jgi:flagellar biosynthesis protein FlhF